MALAQNMTLILVRHLQETKRVLKKDGRLFIYDFDKSTFKGNTIYKIEKFLGEPAKNFTPNEVKKILEKYGFNVRITQYK